MERLIDEIRTRKEILFCIAAAETCENLIQPAISQVAYDFGKLHRALEDKRAKLCRLLHPQREALDRQDEAERQTAQP